MNKFNKKTKEFFDNIAEGVKTEKEDLDKSSQLELEKLLKFLKLPKGSSLIELGCGMGRFVLYFLKKGYKVTGVDISRKSLDVLKKKATEKGLDKNLNLLLTDFKKLVFKEKFDGALCISTFHLLADKEEQRIKIITNLVASLKKGGVLAIIEPNPLNPLFYPFYAFNSKTKWDIEKHFVKSNEINLKRIFSKLNFCKLKIDYFGFLPSRLINKFPFIEKVNNFLNKMPIIKKLSAFIYIKGVKFSV